MIFNIIIIYLFMININNLLYHFVMPIVTNLYKINLRFLTITMNNLNLF
jgi:hypothetical protein